MDFEYFGYKGSFVFTQPLVVTSSDGALTVLATPFGNSKNLEEALDEFIKEFEGQVADPDATNPYPKLTCFNTEENRLHTSIQFLNDYIFSNFNKNKIELGCDLFCIYKHGKSLYFSQIGWPLTLLHSENKTTPVSSEYSISSVRGVNAPFLPPQLLGVETSVNFKIQRINFQKKAELLLLKVNECPDSLLSLYPCPLDKVAETFAEEDPSQGFWLGKISL